MANRKRIPGTLALPESERLSLEIGIAPKKSKRTKVLQTKIDSLQREEDKIEKVSDRISSQRNKLEDLREDEETRLREAFLKTPRGKKAFSRELSLLRPRKPKSAGGGRRGKK